MKNLFLFTFLLLSTLSSEKEYLKKHHPNGKIMEQGWIVDGLKNDYWFYYFENGSKKEEGHYSNNKKTNWWIYYDHKQRIIRKCEYANDVLNGFTITYKNGKIARIEKYRLGTNINSWNTLSEFKKDNQNLFK